MTDVKLPEGSTGHLSPTEVLRRVAVSLLLFTIALLTLLLLSRMFILPRVAEVEVKGVRRSVEDLTMYHISLLAEIARKEQQREASVAPVIDPVHEMLKESRRANLAFPQMREELLQEAAALVSEPDAIHLNAITYDADAKTVEVSGDVRNVGTRSVTVLAAFVTTVRNMPFVKSVQDPSFSRQEDPGIGVHSPFTFSFVLR